MHTFKVVLDLFIVIKFIISKVIFQGGNMKTKHMFVLLIGVLCLVLGAKQESFGSISGEVRRLGTKGPLSGIELACYRDTVLVDIDITGAKGRYRIDKLKPGTYKIVVSSKYYEEQILKKVKVKAGKDTIRNISIDTSVTFMYFTDDHPEINKGKLAVKVKDEFGRALQYVNVVLLQNDTRISGTQTNEKGTGMVKNIPPGTYTVKFSLIGYGAQTMTEVKIESDKTTAFSPIMKRTGWR